MKPEIIKKLNAINLDMYQHAAESFSISRSYPWKGWQLLGQHLQQYDFHPKNILDLGCGNGRFFDFCQKEFTGFNYTGIDFSPELIKLAKSKYTSSSAAFKVADLLNFQVDNPEYDLCVIFAVLHHIPGQVNRFKLLQTALSALHKKSYLVFSTWNFLASEKLSKRIINWKEVGIKAVDLETGDYLLDWRFGSKRYRYIHAFSENEIASYLAKLNVELLAKFDADGKEKDLNSYYIIKT